MTKPPKLSQLTGISDPPFVDVRPAQDNRIYIDPSAIRASAHLGHPYARRADELLRSYFGFVAEASQSHSPIDQAHGEQLLARLGEPNETRLGMSRRGHHGKGMRGGRGHQLWTAIREREVCRASLVPRLEHVPLFVEGMGSDLMSDAVTRIVWPVLADFTSSMRTEYPTLAALPAIERKHQFFDRASVDWAQDEYELPVVDDLQLLLVPREFVSKRLIMNHGQFYRREAIDEIWKDRKVNAAGKRVLKKDLHKEFPHARALNLEQALEARERDEDLVADYEDFTERRFTVMTTEHISEAMMLD